MPFSFTDCLRDLCQDTQGIRNTSASSPYCSGGCHCQRSTFYDREKFLKPKKKTGKFLKEFIIFINIFLYVSDNVDDRGYGCT